MIYWDNGFLHQIQPQPTPEGSLGQRSVGWRGKVDSSVFFAGVQRSPAVHPTSNLIDDSDTNEKRRYNLLALTIKLSALAEFKPNKKR